MKRIFAFTGIVLLAFSTFSQEVPSEEDLSFRESFAEGNQLMEEYNYSVALDIWLDVLKTDPTNANINYKAGVCLWKLPKKKQEALPYFQEARKNVSERYDPFSPAEKGAPIEIYFYIANAYHLNYDLDSAIVFYNKFKNNINHNHEFWARTDLEITMCEVAKNEILNPVDIEVINLGSLVNGQYADYAPVISVDESAIYFTSKRLRSDSSNLYARNPEDGEFYEDIYVTYKGEDGAWNEPEALNLNTSDNEATLSLSADGESLFIYKTGEKGNGDIYLSKLDGLNWTDPVKVGSDVNTQYHETHAALSPDGRRLYFISNRKGSMKFPDKAHEDVYSRDIYFANLLPTGDWALAQPVKELNTPFHEEGVFLHPDGKTMFFSSEGHGSMGGFDIFVSEFQPDSTWGKPKNIGYPLNTTDDDIFFVTSASGKRGYYSSTRDDGFGEKDLYVISMLSFKETPLTLLVGEIVSKDGSEIPDNIEIIVTDNTSGEHVGTFKPRARDHKFTVIIPPGSDYHFDYSFADSVFYKDDYFFPNSSSYQEINKEISLGGIDFSGLQKKMDEKEVERPKSGQKNPNVEGKLQYGTAGAVGVLLNLNDENKNKIASTTTDGNGNFEFQNLNEGSMYFIRIDPSNGKVPDNANLYIKDSESGAMLPVSKMADGSFAFETLPYISPEELKTIEEKEELIVAAPVKKTEVSNEVPIKKTDAPKETAVKKTMPPAYKTEVKEIDGDKYIIHEVKDGETMFDVSLIYNLRFDVVQAANPEMGDLIYAGDRIKLPVPAEVMFYQEFFDYNKFEIRADASDYKNFLIQVEKAVQEKGKATLMIESSSSKVPSSSTDNKALSIKRAENTKSAIVKSMSEKNIGADKLNFADMSTLVRGPEYQNDAKENRATYKSYQYVKVIVK